MTSPTKLSAESFVGLIKQSGLVDHDLLKKTWKELRERGLDTADPKAVADELVARNTLTRWQADKLLQGKHKGFFLGKYRLLSHLGSGGMSAVYLAEHILMRRRVAIKVLPQARVHDSSYLERFHREAQAVAALDHRNIVRAYDVDQEGKVHFLVMEFVAGKSLHELVAGAKPLDPIAAAEYTRQAAEGLHHAHRVGMVHRDIKPGNLLLDERGTVKLLDLGLARFFDDKEENSLTIKHDEKVLGTADFLSPEQALDSHRVDVRSDVYSLGCTLYFLLTGQPPFPDGTLAQRLLAHQTKEPASILKLRPGIPPSLVEVVGRMMAKKPEDRYQTAKDTAQALQDWLTAHGGTAWARMNPTVAGSGSLATGSGLAPPKSSQIVGTDTAQTRAGPQGATSPGPSPNPALSGAGAAPAGDTPLPDFFNQLAAETARQSGSPSALNQTAAGPPPSPATDASQAPFAPTITSPPSGEDVSAFPAAPAAADWSADEPEFAAPFAESAADEFQPTVLANMALPDPPRPPQTMPGSGKQSSPLTPPIAPSAVSSARAGATPRMASSPSLWHRARRKPVLLAAGGVGLAVVIIAGAIATFGNKDAKPPPDEHDQSTKAEQGAANVRPPPRKKVPVKREITVGPEGQFKTIGDALADARKNFNKSRKATQTIHVAAGQTYPERIVIDTSFPRGIQIVADAGAPPVLAPSGGDPVVIIRGGKANVEDFRIEGFILDASGKETAVQLEEWVPGTQLKQLELRGFARQGVRLDGAQTYGAEAERILLQDMVFRDAGPDAVGVTLRRKSEDTRHVRIERCRFLGPMSAGVRFESDVIEVEIFESIFFRTAAGLRFDGAERAWHDVVVAYNTFFENDRGLVFTNMPGSASTGFGFYNNLFVGSVQSDAVIEKDANFANLLNMYRATPGGSAFNWTTRPRPEPPSPQDFLQIFESRSGRFAANDVQFASTDPMDPGFLAPASAGAQRQVGTILDPRRFGPQVGARRPGR